MLTKIGFGAAALGFIVAGILYWQFSLERKAHDDTKALLVAESVKARVAEARLSDVQEQQAEQIRQIQILEGSVNDAQVDLREAQQRSIAVQADLEWLSLREPFKAGNIASDLLCDGMLSVYTAAGGGDSSVLAGCRIHTDIVDPADTVSADSDDGGGPPG